MASALLLALIAAAPCGAAPRSVPDLAGLQPGMTTTEVLATLRTGGLPLDNVVRTPCLSDYLAEHSKVVSPSRRGHCISQIASQYAGGTLLVFFAEALPKRPGISVAFLIALNYPSDQPAIDSLVRRAGPPSLTDGLKPWVIALWCFDFSCSDISKALNDPASGTFLFVHRGSGITLESQSVREKYGHALFEALRLRGVLYQP